MKKTLSALVAGTLGVFFAAAAPLTASAETISSTDFSRYGYENVTLNSAQLLENVLGEELTPTEVEYLGLNTDLTLKYYDRITSKNIAVDFNGDSGLLSVSASPFSYTAANDSLVMWTPALVDGKPYSENWEDNYGGQTADYVTVTYATEFYIDAEQVNGILNMFYNASQSAAQLLEQKNFEYDRAYDEYTQNLAKFKQYQEDMIQYGKDLEAYEAYLTEYNSWNRKNSAYLDYVERLKQYEKAKADFDAYVAKRDQYYRDLADYNRYQSELQKYKADLEAYNSALNNPLLKRFKEHLRILEYLDLPAGDNRTLRKAINSGSVDTVLANLSALNDAVLNVPGVGVDRKALDKASEATKNLRDILSHYSANMDDEAKYTFYMSHYTALTQNMCDLLRVLEHCYRSTAVQGEIQRQNKVEQFEILLAQLYEICNALSVDKVTKYEQEYKFTKPNAEDDKYFTANFKISGKTPAQILGASVIPDTGADALPIDYEQLPQIPPEPVMPQEVNNPTPPEPVQEPVKPQEVLPAGEQPKEVKYPELPEEVTEPQAPEKYIPTEWENRLSLAYNSGAINKRNAFDAPVKVALSTDVIKYFRNVTNVTVSFCLTVDGESKSVYEEEIQKGTFPEFPAELFETYGYPHMERTGYTCTFDGWCYEDGNKVDWSNLPDRPDLKVYPYFTQTPNQYDVVWVIDGKEYPARATFGTVPNYNDSYQGDPQKVDDEDGRMYRFRSWDRVIGVMTTQKVYYYAQFEASVLVSFYVDGAVIFVDSVWNGEEPQFDGVPERPADSRSYYTFRQWDRPIGAVKEGKDERYYALFDSHYILETNNGGATVVLTEDNYYSVDCHLARQNTFDISNVVSFAREHSAGITIRCPDNSTLSFTPEDVEELWSKKITSFTTNIKNPAKYKYSIAVELSGNARTSLYEGTFNISVKGDFDYYNSHLYMLNEQGEERAAFTFDEEAGTINFAMYAGYTYVMYPLYNVYTLEYDGVNSFSVSKQTAELNDYVKINIGSLDPGRTFERLYVLDSEGNEVQLNSDNSFYMPASDVSVGLSCGFIEYVITFVSDGLVISRKTYHYGDEVALPHEPARAPSNGYVFEFIGWDREVETVTQDAEYIARFRSTLISEVPGDDGGGKELSGKMKILVWLANNFVFIVIALVLVVGLAVTGTVLLVYRIKSKRKKAKK